MKKICCFFICVFSCANVFAQNDLSENDKLASLCKVWGFLKYYHPGVITGKLDWDKEFTDHVPLVLSANDRQELSRVYVAWINGLGAVKPGKKSAVSLPDSMKLNLNLKWIEDTRLFSDTVIAMLHRIEQCKRGAKNYYAQKAYKKGYAHFKNEEPYKDSVYPSLNFRLLTLSRYWNIINYYYPYKYLLDEDWNEVLAEMIPEFEYPEDTVSYHLAMLELVAKINDSHAFYGDKYTYKFFGTEFVPFRCNIVEDQMIVAGFYNDSLAQLDDIRYGDVILSVNGVSVDKIVAARSKYITGSNESARNRNAPARVFNGDADSCTIEFERDGNVGTKVIHRYPYAVINYEWKPVQKETSKIIDNNVGYVDLSRMKQKHVKKTLRPLMSTKSLVLDLRVYPEMTMGKVLQYLNPERKRFALYTNPGPGYAGTFKYSRGRLTGKRNKDYYKGEVIVLLNEYTQSRGEFYGLALKTLPNVTFIGSQTAGTDGGVCTITFPGGSGTWMTHTGIYYPDGRICQRTGITPDIKITPTIKGIRAKKDEVLERAIEYAKTGK